MIQVIPVVVREPEVAALLDALFGNIRRGLHRRANLRLHHRTTAKRERLLDGGRVDGRLAGVGGLELQHAGVGELKRFFANALASFASERTRTRSCGGQTAPAEGVPLGAARPAAARRRGRQARRSSCATPGGRATAGRPWPRARLPGGPRVASGLRSCAGPPKPRRAVTIRHFSSTRRRKPRQNGWREPRQKLRHAARAGKEPQEPKNQTTPPIPSREAFGQLDHDRGELRNRQWAKTLPACQRQPRRGPPHARCKGTV